MILVKGKNSSGKSRYAEGILRAAGTPFIYLATMIPYGEYGKEKIERHRKLRDDLKAVLSEDPYLDFPERIPEGSAVLLEDISNLAANRFFDRKEGTEEIVNAVRALAERCSLLVVVSIDMSETESDDEDTLRYIAMNEDVNAAMEKEAETVIEMRNGNPVLKKGALPESRGKQRTLYLLRHGLTKANEMHCYCGSTDLPLSENGVHAIRRKILAGVYPEIGDTSVTVSDLQRAQQTFRLIYGDHPFHTEPRLREMNFGVFEMRSHAEMEQDPQYLQWLNGDNYANTAPDGESGVLMRKRVLEALEEILSEDGDQMIVSHGGPVGTIMTALFGTVSGYWYEWQPLQGEGYQILFEGKRPVFWKRITETDSALS